MQKELYYCNPNGCNEHDFKTASIWCAYQDHLSREERKIQAMNEIAESMNKPIASAVQTPQADIPQRQARPARTVVNGTRRTLGTLEYPELDPVLNTYGEVEAHRTVFDGLNSKISFVGYDLEQKATGLHGIIEVYLDSTQVAWDNINYTKATQRKAVAGDAYSDGDLDFVAKFYPRKHMHKDLAVFAKKAYPIYLGKVEVDMVYGDPMLEIREYIKGLIPMGTGVIVNSRPGMGKSWIVMLIAVTVDSGSTTLWNAEQGNVLYINLERSESSMRRRLGGVNTSLGLDYNRPLRFLNVRGRSLVDIGDSVKKIVEKRILN